MKCLEAIDVKKTVQLIGMLGLLIVLGIFLLHIENRTVQLRVNENLEFELSLDTKKTKEVLKELDLFCFVYSVVVVQLLSRVQLFATPWTAACQATLFSTISWNLLKIHVC